MFRTEHLEGRLRYETDKVVCFDIYLSPNLAKDHFVTQALLSLVNGTKVHNSSNIHKDASCLYLDSTTIAKEISEGIESYINIRKELALTPPYSTTE